MKSQKRLGFGFVSLLVCLSIPLPPISSVYAEKEEDSADTPIKPEDALVKSETLRHELEAEVTSHRLSAVHETVEHLTAMLNRLQGLSDKLPPKRQSQITTAVTELITLLDELHEAADEGNQSRSEKYLKEVDAKMKHLAELYK